MFGKAFSKIKSAVEGRLVKAEAAVLAAETEGGQGTTEYALLIGLFIVAVIVAMTAVPHAGGDLVVERHQHDEQHPELHLALMAQNGPGAMPGAGPDRSSG